MSLVRNIKENIDITNTKQIDTNYMEIMQDKDVKTETIQLVLDEVNTLVETLANIVSNEQDITKKNAITAILSNARSNLRIFSSKIDINYTEKNNNNLVCILGSLIIYYTIESYITIDSDTKFFDSIGKVILNLFTDNDSYVGLAIINYIMAVRSVRNVLNIKSNIDGSIDLSSLTIDTKSMAKTISDTVKDSNIVVSATGTNVNLSDRPDISGSNTISDTVKIDIINSLVDVGTAKSIAASIVVNTIKNNNLLNSFINDIINNISKGANNIVDKIASQIANNIFINAKNNYEYLYTHTMAMDSLANNYKYGPPDVYQQHLADAAAVKAEYIAANNLYLKSSSDLKSKNDIADASVNAANSADSNSSLQKLLVVGLMYKPYNFNISLLTLLG
jgi:hypothetical protein